MALSREEAEAFDAIVLAFDLERASRATWHTVVASLALVAMAAAAAAAVGTKPELIVAFCVTFVVALAVGLTVLTAKTERPSRS